MRERGLPIERLVEWMSAAPAALAGLAATKGAIAPGFDADLVLFDPNGVFDVRADMLLHRHAVTPYLAASLRGTVEATYVRGVRAYDRRTGPAETPPGALLLPSHP
jgi:allantoinase